MPQFSYWTFNVFFIFLDTEKCPVLTKFGALRHRQKKFSTVQSSDGNGEFKLSLFSVRPVFFSSECKLFFSLLWLEDYDKRWAYRKIFHILHIHSKFWICFSVCMYFQFWMEYFTTTWINLMKIFWISFIFILEFPFY